MDIIQYFKIILDFLRYDNDMAHIHSCSQRVHANIYDFYKALKNNSEKQKEEKYGKMLTIGESISVCFTIF